MKRIASSTAVAVAPTYSADAGTPGHFSESPNPTHLTAKFCEGLQEGHVRTIEDAGETPADDMAQFSNVVAGVHAIKSGVTTTGTVSTPRLRSVIASQTSAASGADSVVVGSSVSVASGAKSAVVGSGLSIASGAGSAVIASVAVAAVCEASGASSAVIACDTSALASGAHSAVIASKNSTASGTGAAVLGGESNTASGDQSAVVGSVSSTASNASSAVVAANASTCVAAQSAVIASYKGHIGGGAANSALLGSTNCELNNALTVGGGYHATAITPSGANQYLTWRIDSTSGDIYTDGTAGAGAADFAEMFENATAGAIPLGTLVARDGRKVRLALPGDRVHGVVSASPAMLGGSPQSWPGRYVRDEWGSKRVEDVNGVVAPASSPDYDPTRPYVPRTARPAEWTPVALVGQVRVRIDAGVHVDDFLAPGPDGCAVATASPSGRPVEVMEIVQEYDPAKGYGVALCLVG